jgi:hypothetical protein
MDEKRAIIVGASHPAANSFGPPEIVVQNMPGAGSLVAANHIHTVGQCLSRHWGFGSRPIVSTAGLPPDRLKTLSDAFMKMFKDPEVIEEIKKREWEAEPVAGDAWIHSPKKSSINRPMSLLH